jgi:hypothetical protein
VRATALPTGPAQKTCVIEGGGEVRLLHWSLLERTKRSPTNKEIRHDHCHL